MADSSPIDKLIAPRNYHDHATVVFGVTFSVEVRVTGARGSYTNLPPPIDFPPTAAVTATSGGPAQCQTPHRYMNANSQLTSIAVPRHFAFFRSPSPMPLDTRQTQC